MLFSFLIYLKSNTFKFNNEGVYLKMNVVQTKYLMQLLKTQKDMQGKQNA